MSDLIDKIHLLIAEEGVTVKEAIVALTTVQFSLLTAPLVSNISNVETPTATVPHTPKSIKYDPLYDPAPPFNVDQVPPRVETPTRVLAANNTACICNSCKKVVYITNTEVKDGMKVADFINAYTPTTGMPKMDRTVEIQNFDGNIACDCPACNASKQLYLTGGPRA